MLERPSNSTMDTKSGLTASLSTFHRSLELTKSTANSRPFYISFTVIAAAVSTGAPELSEADAKAPSACQGSFHILSIFFPRIDRDMSSSYQSTAIRVSRLTNQFPQLLLSWQRLFT